MNIRVYTHLLCGLCLTSFMYKLSIFYDCDRFSCRVVVSEGAMLNVAVMKDLTGQNYDVYFFVDLNSL